MSPQRLSQFIRKGGKPPQKPATLTFVLSAENQPLLAPVAEVITIASLMEMYFMEMMIDQTGDPEGTATIWTTLVGTSAKDAVVFAAIDHALTSQEDKALFKSAWKAAKTLRDTRNKFAHWIWGETESVPGFLALIPPKYLVGHGAKVESSRRAMARDNREELPDATMDAYEVLLYSPDDLQRELMMAQKALIRVGRTRFALRPRDHRDAVSRFQLLEELGFPQDHSQGMPDTSPPESL